MNSITKLSTKNKKLIYNGNYTSLTYFKSSNILNSVAARAFSNNTTLTSINPEMNHKLRVMSTPEWPVPYWQRIYRSDPVPHDADTYDISKPVEYIDDRHVIIAKEWLKSTGQGYVVEAVENHFNIKSYVTSFEDSSKFTEAYVDDLLDSIDVVHRQNSKLLNNYDLSECLHE